MGDLRHERKQDKKVKKDLTSVALCGTCYRGTGRCSLNLPELSDDAAKALGAMAADYLKTMDAVNSILSITREKTTVSRNVAVSGNGSHEGETVLSENTVVSENGSEITYSVIRR